MQSYKFSATPTGIDFNRILTENAGQDFILITVKAGKNAVLLASKALLDGIEGASGLSLINKRFTRSGSYEDPRYHGVNDYIEFDTELTEPGFKAGAGDSLNDFTPIHNGYYGFVFPCAQISQVQREVEAIRAHTHKYLFHVRAL